MFSQIFIFLSAAVFSLLITFPLLWMLRFFHSAQSIRKEGPDSHQAKAGTPTMGGIGIILTIIIFALIFIDFDLDGRYLALILLVIGFALVGLSDDLFKILRHKNLGLTFWQKIILQTIVAGLFSAQFLGSSTSFFYFLFSIFVIVGTANAANLTDGLDGLLAGCAGIAFLAFALLCSRLGSSYAAAFSFASAGAVIAFLYFNFPKAKVFMGDVGSLSLGAALAGMAILIHQELSLIIIGGVFVVEALSVILQVGYYKLFKKRIFKMAPLHHHFELLGYGERSIVVAFWIAALVCAIWGVLI